MKEFITKIHKLSPGKMFLPEEKANQNSYIIGKRDELANLPKSPSSPVSTEATGMTQALTLRQQREVTTFGYLT